MANILCALLALSIQRALALEHYWQHDLGLPSSDLPRFLDAARSAPILLPFDMTYAERGMNYSSIMRGGQKVSSFPPPLACSPMIDATRLKNINAIEQGAFGLSAIASVPATFDSSCFTNRPVYGVLDLLRLRTPFVDGRAQVAKQAVVLNPDASLRLVVRAGEALVGYPSPATPVNYAPSALDPKSYGTIDNLNHVLLNYLRMMPVDEASKLASYIASSTNIPPSADFFNSTTTDTAKAISTTNSTTAFTFADVPVLEVALFGTLGSDDVASTVSSLSTPSGSLFFGSDNGDIFRQWAVQSSVEDNSVTWADSAFAPRVYKESKSADNTFFAVWQGASTLISNAQAVGTTTGAADVATLMGVFDQIGYLSS